MTANEEPRGMKKIVCRGGKLLLVYVDGRVYAVGRHGFGIAQFLLYMVFLGMFSLLLYILLLEIKFATCWQAAQGAFIGGAIVGALIFSGGMTSRHNIKRLTASDITLDEARKIVKSYGVELTMEQIKTLERDGSRYVIRVKNKRMILNEGDYSEVRKWFS
jgi:hypothetical protein